MIAIIHAYSRHNAGDGLLVDLTRERLKRAGINIADCVLVAMDPESFPEIPNKVKIGTSGRSADKETALAAGTAALSVAGSFVRPLARGAAAKALSEASAYVAVGGGYLRAGNRVNAIGTMLNHVPQLVAVARSSKPSIYLPQSVGPLSGPVGSIVRTTLARAGAVHLRDDRSMDELRGASNLHRTADLAVLEVADNFGAASAPADAAGTPVIVARALTVPRDYDQRLLALQTDLGDVVWGVQSEGSATKNDRTYYSALGVSPAGRLEDLLAAGGTGPVVSVRLHGALQSILSGVPAIHLGYERKSWGAYDDLGLGEWVHSARGFDPALVARQVRALSTDPSAFWDALAANVDRLVEQSGRLDSSLRELLG